MELGTFLLATDEIGEARERPFCGTESGSDIYDRPGFEVYSKFLTSKSSLSKLVVSKSSERPRLWFSSHLLSADLCKIYE